MKISLEDGPIRNFPNSLFSKQHAETSFMALRTLMTHFSGKLGKAPSGLLCLCLFILVIASCQAAITEEDVRAFSAWQDWDYSQKLNFLLYDEDWANLRVEYAAKDLEDENSVAFEDFYRVHEDHLEEEKIGKNRGKE